MKTQIKSTGFGVFETFSNPENCNCSIHLETNFISTSKLKINNMWYLHWQSFFQQKYPQKNSTDTYSGKQQS
jgi:hypothetical protein